MNISLPNTTASEVSKELLRARQSSGATTQGRVFTLVVVTTPPEAEEALAASQLAATEHPSRILMLVDDPNAESSGLDAEVRLNRGSASSETLVLHLRGEVAEHPASVVTALLLPDSPVVVWWPTTSPVSPIDDPIGAVADRRITDALGDADPLQALRIRAANHQPGDTDLTWTRLTQWRALLAAALDQYPHPVTEAVVEAAEDNASAELMVAWLASRLDVPVHRLNSEGPGITRVKLVTEEGTIRITRTDARHARFEIPGQPEREVALPRRILSELITEELRRMDADEVFEETTRALLARQNSDRADSPASDEGDHR
ncbi:glucose-6-phosphate dehydrogenase assembly protein OpcA [Enemella sp. A6]|uniref:glucose-6-phosphate dehydrogenase assembly protein OpcA n=1 Tax=Enemella sp. A6 TaxID=3440152 RepID=UPI003EB751B5